MKFTIIISEKDQASLNIEKALKTLKLPKNIEILKIKQESIHAENIDKTLKTDFIIFATKHQSKEERKTLNMHVPGNWDKAEMGGKDSTLCPTIASIFKEVFIELNKQSKDYQVSTEQIHHGPYLETPCFFIEIGSTKAQWTDPKPAQIIAKTLLKALSNPHKTYKTLLLLGGQHYNQRANKILLETKYAINYICAKHSLKHLNKALLQQALIKSKEPTEFIILDWKALGTEKKHVTNLLDSLKIPYKRYKQL